MIRAEYFFIYPPQFRGFYVNLQRKTDSTHQTMRNDFFSAHDMKNELLGWMAIYNIRDTTRFSFSSYEEGMPFVEHTWTKDTAGLFAETDYVSEYYITVTDSNLSAMQKDYSMLEKFPQYYGGQ